MQALSGLVSGALAGSIGMTATMLAFAAIYLVACLPPFVGKVWRGLDSRIGLSVQPNE